MAWCLMFFLFLIQTNTYGGRLMFPSDLLRSGDKTSSALVEFGYLTNNNAVSIPGFSSVLKQTFHFPLLVLFIKCYWITVLYQWKNYILLLIYKYIHNIYKLKKYPSLYSSGNLEASTFSLIRNSTTWGPTNTSISCSDVNASPSRAPYSKAALEFSSSFSFFTWKHSVDQKCSSYY